MISSLTMQLLILAPFTQTRNPVQLNVLAWALGFMNYTKELSPRRK